MRTEPHTDDYVFLDKPLGIVLHTCPLANTEQAETMARRLARKYQTIITVVAVVYYSVEPERCQSCGDIMPETGMCWCSSFEEDWIPFDGRPMPGREATPKDFIGL
jgi:hypothetical protein